MFIPQTETLKITYFLQMLAAYIQYILKYWQHISNKICSFPKTETLKITYFLRMLGVGSIYPMKHSSPKCWHHISNIFSNVGSIYPIKYVHSPSVGIIYPIFLTIFENFNNFANFDIVDIFKIILSSMSPVLNVACPQCPGPNCLGGPNCPGPNCPHLKNGQLGPGQLSPGPNCPGPNCPPLKNGQLGPGQLGPRNIIFTPATSEYTTMNLSVTHY